MSPKTSQGQSNDQSPEQWLTFTMEQETYGIEVLRVKEALRYMEIFPVPGSPPHVIGIISIRGEVIIVNNMWLLLGLREGETTDQSRIILLEVSGKTEGILVDSVTGIVEVDPFKIEAPAGQGEDHPHVKGTFHHEGSLLILLEVDKLLIDDDSADD